MTDTDHDPVVVAQVDEWRRLMGRLEAGAVWLASHPRTHPRYREAQALHRRLSDSAYACFIRLVVAVGKRPDRDIYWIANMPGPEQCHRVCGGSSRLAWQPDWLKGGQP